MTKAKAAFLTTDKCKKKGRLGSLIKVDGDSSFNI